MLKMPKKAVRKPSAPRHAKARRKASVQLKFPRAGEKVSRPHYAVQIETSPDPVRVELRINDAAWVPCREALGLWWFDWTGFEPGAHRLVARVMTPDGDSLESIEREIFAV